MHHVRLDNLVILKDTQRVPVVASVSIPKQTADGDWLSEVELTGLDHSGVYRSFGADSYQAMRLGFSILIDLIQASGEWKRGEIFVCENDGHLENLDEDVLSSLR